MRVIAIALLLAGLGFLGYSSFNIWSTDQEQKDSAIQAEELLSMNEKDDMSKVSPNKDISSTVVKKEENTVQDTSSDDLSDEPKEDSFKFTAEIGDEIGMLLLPKIDAALPIIEGVSEKELKKGVGHYNGTAFPSEPGQIVLSGHRDTVFRRMGELKIGDEITVKMPYGNFTYVMERTEIVSADDLSVIRPHAYDEETLTITTCYPFRYIGDAPDRYIIYAKPITKVED